MAGYDPKRTRPPVTEAAAGEPAAIDALLEATGEVPRVVIAPEVDPVVVADPPPVVEPSDREPSAAPSTAAERPIPVDVPVAPGPDRTTARIAVVAGVAAATVAAILLLRRTRRR